MDGWEVNVSLVDMPPGRDGRPHHHPGFVLAYVLEGAIVTKISDQPEITYKTGQVFYEPPGSTHQVSRNASKTEPAKLLASDDLPQKRAALGYAGLDYRAAL
jgi:quercetin dioxygenase-like cupin family protein